MVDGHHILWVYSIVPCVELGGGHERMLLAKLWSYNMGHNMPPVFPSYLECMQLHVCKGSQKLAIDGMYNYGDEETMCVVHHLY